MKKIIKKIKGFTLTELIVVIAIIGILAAVLIPSITGYIKKAKKSTDVQMAGEMTREIQWYCLDNDMNQDNVTGTDVRTILLLRGYDLTPSAKDWSFVYNTDSKKVEVTDFKKGEIAAALDYDPIDPTEIKKGHYLIGEGENPIEQAVKTLCNLENLGEYDSIMTETTSNGDLVNYKEFLELFSPNNTLYVNNGFVLTNNQQTTKDRVVFLDKTVHVPSLTSYDVTSVKLPECILSSDQLNTSLLSDSNITYVNVDNLTKIEISDTNVLTLGNAILSSKMESVSFEITKVAHNVKFDTTLQGITVKDDKSFDKLAEITATSTPDVINEAINWDGGLGLIKEISIIITRTAKVCYYSEKGLIAYGTKDIVSEACNVTYFNYQNLLNSINK